MSGIAGTTGCCVVMATRGLGWTGSLRISATLHATSKSSAFRRRRGDPYRRILVATMSEFGHRPALNGSRGLGRGTASTALLVGSRLARPYREPPDLVQLDEDDNFVATTHSYATLAETWFGFPGRRPPPGSPTPLK